MTNKILLPGKFLSLDQCQSNRGLRRDREAPNRSLLEQIKMQMFIYNFFGEIKQAWAMYPLMYSSYSLDRFFVPCKQ